MKPDYTEQVHRLQDRMGICCHSTANDVGDGGVQRAFQVDVREKLRYKCLPAPKRIGVSKQQLDKRVMPRLQVGSLGKAIHTMCDLAIHFINTLPVLVASCHSRESGNPGDERHGNWMPAGACPRVGGGGHDVLLAPDLRNRHLAMRGWRSRTRARRNEWAS